MYSWSTNKVTVPPYVTWQINVIEYIFVQILLYFSITFDVYKLYTGPHPVVSDACCILVSIKHRWCVYYIRVIACRIYLYVTLTLLPKPPYKEQ